MVPPAPDTDTDVPLSAGQSQFGRGEYDGLMFFFFLFYSYYCTLHWTALTVDAFVSCRRRSRSASSSGSSSSGSRSPKKAMKRISSTPPRKQLHHPDTSISPAGKDRRSPSPRGRRGRGSASPPRSSGMIRSICHDSLHSSHLFLVLTANHHFSPSALSGFQELYHIINTKLYCKGPNQYCVIKICWL